MAGALHHGCEAHIAILLLKGRVPLLGKGAEAEAELLTVVNV